MPGGRAGLCTSGTGTQYHWQGAGGSSGWVDPWMIGVISWLYPCHLSFLSYMLKGFECWVTSGISIKKNLHAMTLRARCFFCGPWQNARPCAVQVVGSLRQRYEEVRKKKTHELLHRGFWQQANFGNVIVLTSQACEYLHSSWGLHTFWSGASAGDAPSTLSPDRAGSCRWEPGFVVLSWLIHGAKQKISASWWRSPKCRPDDIWIFSHVSEKLEIRR